MDPKELAQIWIGPDRARVTARQISIRLPLHVMAKIRALAAMFPGKTRTTYIGDLLSAALDRFAEGLPNEPGPGRDSFECTDGSFHGPRGMYEFMWRGLLKDVEKEEGVEGSETGELFEFVETKGPGHPDFEKAKGKRAPGGPGASARPTTEARPAADPGGAQQARKPGGRRRPAKG